MSKTPKHEDKFLEVSNEILNALSKAKCGLSINYGEIFDFYEVENDRSYLNDHSCLSESQSLGEIESLCKSNIENEKKKTKKEEIRKLEEELDNTLGIFPHSIYVNKSTSEDPLLQRHNSGDNEGISEDSLPEYIGWNNYNPTQLRVADYVDPSLDTVIQPGDSSESSDLITLTENSESSLEFEETLTESSESFLKPEETPKNEYRTDYSHLWVRCEFCEIINYKEDCKKRLFICEFCEAQLKIDSSDRIELLIDPGTWCPMGGDMVSVDPIQWDREGEEYGHSLAYYQEETGLPDAIKTGVGQLNGIPLALGVMDFRFIAGSMGCAVGETITSLIEYATIHSLPLIIVCASGGARVQEGILSLMQMAKIAHALYNRHQSNPNLFYISLLASATTGGVLASFGMLGNIVISEPDAEIAFAGKRVIEAVLKEEVPEDVQVSEFLFENGAFELLLPRPLLKSSLSELLKFHGFLPLNSNSIK
uniref:acetyl-CoA carboxylase carboxyltransferase beta subunit n=1 Tax=Cymbaria mongolica TaxID=374685 RepID=UPI0022773BAE|nr:acetyl-CoA carboxylase carboxyltransferase beta subunit [Cymbaria mongolica]URT60424.2 acetyl-CoA carboxylase carboxyltransferase beta subunit [Cymbaria mongolica]